MVRKIRENLKNEKQKYLFYLVITVLPTGVRSQEVRKGTLLNSGKRLENSNGNKLQFAYLERLRDIFMRKLRC